LGIDIFEQHPMIERKTFIPFGDSATPSIDYLLGILEDARATTLQRVEGISTQELHWQYAEGWNTIGALLQHMISGENYMRIEFIGQRELTDAEAEQWMPGIEMGKYIPQLITKQPVEEYVSQMKLSRNKIVEEIKLLSTEEFYRKREGYNPKTGYNLAWVLYHSAEDEVHHRGQISIIRKLYKLHQSGR
jgi:uncharacterized damage-inducible protein DinB